MLAWAGPRWEAEDLLAWAGPRWEAEVSHRALKTAFGVGQVQCWPPTATVRAVQQQVWAYAVGVLAGSRAGGYAGQHAALRSRGLWWCGATRWSVATLWRGYRQALGQQAAFPPARAGTRGTWAEQDAWRHHLHAVFAAALPA